MLPVPLWDEKNLVVRGESALFTDAQGVRLLFPAQEILKVYNPVLNVVYEKDLHYIHTPGTPFLYPVPGSGICGFFDCGIFPDPATAKVFPAPGANAISGGPEGKLLVFGEGDFFARNQITVDYKAVEGTTFPRLPVLRPGQLPRTCARLKTGEGTLRCTIIGDSISAGFNATEFVKSPPYEPPYFIQFVRALRQRFGTFVSASNCAVNGSGSQAAFNITSQWLEPENDLLIIAYGMNDLSAMEPDEYCEAIRAIIKAKNARHPETEFILVAPMMRNPLWRDDVSAKSEAFAGVLHLLASENCAVADLYWLWKKVTEVKKFYDITGNGVNHPNDYGHKLYAKVLTDLFREI